jgi:hypothetical protein
LFGQGPNKNPVLFSDFVRKVKHPNEHQNNFEMEKRDDAIKLICSLELHQLRRVQTFVHFAYYRIAPTLPLALNETEVNTKPMSERNLDTLSIMIMEFDDNTLDLLGMVVKHCIIYKELCDNTEPA